MFIGRMTSNASVADKHHKRPTSHREDLLFELKTLQNNTPFEKLLLNSSLTGMDYLYFHSIAKPDAADLKNENIATL